MARATDTTAAAANLLYGRLRELSPAQRLAMMAAMSRSVCEIARAGIRSRHPHADEREVAIRLASLTIDAETMRKAFGWDVETEGLG